jgi:hypothetical protein
MFKRSSARSPAKKGNLFASRKRPRASSSISKRLRPPRPCPVRHPQMGKSRNEIRPAISFRSRAVRADGNRCFCHPNSSPQWYQYWRDRLKWYRSRPPPAGLRLREHDKDSQATIPAALPTSNAFPSSLRRIRRPRRHRPPRRFRPRSYQGGCSSHATASSLPSKARRQAQMARLRQRPILPRRSHGTAVHPHVIEPSAGTRHVGLPARLITKISPRRVARKCKPASS